MKQSAQSIAPRIYKNYQFLFQQTSALSAREQVASLGHDLSNCFFNLKKRKNSERTIDFSQGLIQENQEANQRSILKALEYSMLAKYSRYLEEIKMIEKKIDLKNPTKSKIVGNKKTRLNTLYLKMSSCNPENLEKIKTSFKKNKNHAYYCQKAIKYMIHGQCHHLLTVKDLKLSPKQQREKLYQIVRKDWAFGARHAYWPRLLGGSSHITGNILSLIALLLKQTSIASAAHFLTGFSRIASDAIMGSTRLSFKAFEELNIQYLFFKPAGILEKGAGIKKSLSIFEKNLKKINHNHPSLQKMMLASQTDPSMIAIYAKQLNTEELILANEIKQSLLQLRAARYREKIESSGSGAQLRNNLGLGGIQFILNLLKLIPSPSLQIALNILSITSAISQHTLNYFMAPTDFCRKMEQNCISQLNLTHGNAAFKIKFQAQMQLLKKEEQKIKHKKSTNKNHSNLENLSRETNKSFFAEQQELLKDFCHGANKPLHYRLKNLQEAQSQIILKNQIKIKKMHMQSLHFLKLLRCALGDDQKNKNLSDQMLLIYLNNLKISDDIWRIRDQKQKKIVQIILNIEEKIQRHASRLEKMKSDFDQLKIIENAGNRQSVEKSILNIKSPKLKNAIENQNLAIQYIVSSKKKSKGEMFRYFYSYLAPSIMTGAILAPLLISAITLPSTPHKYKLKTANACIVNMVSGLQQLTTGANNAARDVLKYDLSKNSDHALKINTPKKNKIIDVRHQFQISTQMRQKHRRISCEFLIECALAPLTAIFNHKRAADTLEKYQGIFDMI